jgi:hypothetical protein
MIVVSNDLIFGIWVLGLSVALPHHRPAQPPGFSPRDVVGLTWSPLAIPPPSKLAALMLDFARRPLATMEPKSDVRGLRSTSGYLLGAYWCLKPSGRSPEVAHDDSIGA